MKLFVDLDDTLADFRKGCQILFNEPAHIPKWDFFNEWGYSREEFWAVIDKHPDFWANLPKMEFFQECLDLVIDFDPDYKILTSPHNSGFCYAGKRDWIEKHLKIHPPTRVHMFHNKYGFSSKGRILIDDNPTNIDKWEEKGGTGLLFPAPWNKNNKLHPVKYLEQELGRLSK